MANLCVTSACQKSCAYCFARDAFSTKNAGAAHMTLATFRQALDFLKRSKIKQARLLGGEPTLHPDFPLLLKEAADRHPDILLFSNGLIPGSTLDAIEAVPEKKIRLLINATDYAPPSKPLPAALTNVLSRLGRRVMLGFNISTPAADPSALIGLIEAYRLSGVIRLGLAHPSVHGSNLFLRSRHYSETGKMVARFAAQARNRGIELELDCGFVPCMFPEGFAEMMGPGAQDIGRRCNPVLDILPNGRIVSCYPLAAQASFPLDSQTDAARLRREFSAVLARYTAVGIFRECSSCRLFAERLCSGGCRAAAVNRLRTATVKLDIPANLLKPSGPSARVSTRGKAPAPAPATAAKSETSGTWMIPYIDQPLPFWQRLADEFTEHIEGVYFPVPGGSVASGRPRQPEKHLQRFLRRSPFGLNVLINSVVLPRPVDKLAPEILENLKRLHGELGVCGVTVASLPLACRIKEALPALSVTASTLMDISRPHQAAALNGICDTLVPAGRIMRDIAALAALKKAFTGNIRLIVNEACLPDCIYRVQHFYEMAGTSRYPQSLCRKMLEDTPWLRLTGAWVLPQHLHLFDGLYDGLKLAGRVTLREPSDYRRVLSAYVHRTDLFPHEIGGGPASITTPLAVTEEFYRQTLQCRRDCHQCGICRDYFQQTPRSRKKPAKGRTP